MNTALQFFRSYPRASLVTVFAFLFSGVAEGIGLLSFVPLLYFSLGGGANPGNPEDGTPLGLMQDVEILSQISNLLGNAMSIEVVIVAIFIGLTLNNYFILLANRQIGITTAKISFDFRVQVLRSIYRSRWEYFVNQPTGYFSGRLTNEVKRAASTYMNSALLVAFIAQCVTYLVLAALISPELTTLAVGVALLAYAISRKFISQSKAYGKANTHYIKEIARRAIESLNGIKAIKAMGREPFLEKEFFKEISSLRESQAGQVGASERLKLWQNEIVLAFMLLGLWASFYSDWISPVEVLLLAAVLMRFFSQTAKVSSQIQKIATSESAYYSLNGFLEHAESNREIIHGGNDPTLFHGIQFEEIEFYYGEKKVLDKLSIAVPANRITTLVGPSGAGKTTILDLVAALLEPQGGEIRVDGVSLRSLDIAKWRRMIGYVPQEPFLLHDTIHSNVTLGDESISRAEVKRALEEANAAGFISALEGGLEFNVGERGSKLSGGQRQRIMIARALVHRPLLLIFDEATSSLDLSSEQEVCNTIVSLKANHTIICASHRSLLIDSADQVIDLEEAFAVASTAESALQESTAV
ncbi:ABC transporter ATP-binding protein/permease [bacterium]|nr:ABC transporter ATP-binding protein/permease [bacterium]